jgi:hypothetical protein
METLILKEDLSIFYVAAKSFPDGIQEAFDKLAKTLPTTEGRTFFGISHKNHEGTIIYKAGVLAFYKGEGKTFGLETYIIKKGEYLTETIHDWKKNMAAIGSTFQVLLADPRLDTTGACVEWYKPNDEVMCMVRLEV